MEPWIVWLIAAFVVFDAIVLWWIFTKRRMPALGGHPRRDAEGRVAPNGLQLPEAS